jgi:putative tryptophan/tyrosine transport system substrate-binding protein
MRRREFITLLSGAVTVLTPPRGTLAQQPGKVRRLGYLTTAAGPNPVDDAYEEELRHLGWVNGQNLRIEYRYTSGRRDAVPPLVNELIGSGLDAWVTWGPTESISAKRATTQIPLICMVLWDPIDIGLVSNLRQPGGNVTGVTGIGSIEIFAKRLQLLTELVPSLSHVAVLVSTEQQGSSGPKDALARAAKSLGLELREFQVKVPSDLDAAMRSAKDWGAQGLYTFPGGFTFSFPKQIVDAANAYHLATVGSHSEIASAGGLLAYAVDLKEMARRGAWYVDKILRGTPPGDLPFEQASKYQLVINLSSAKALGLTVSPSLIAVADRVIE